MIVTGRHGAVDGDELRAVAADECHLLPAILALLVEALDQPIALVRGLEAHRVRVRDHLARCVESEDLGQRPVDIDEAVVRCQAVNPLVHIAGDRGQHVLAATPGTRHLVGHPQRPCAGAQQGEHEAAQQQGDQRAGPEHQGLRQTRLQGTRELQPQVAAGQGQLPIDLETFGGCGLRRLAVEHRPRTAGRRDIDHAHADRGLAGPRECEQLAHRQRPGGPVLMPARSGIDPHEQRVARLQRAVGRLELERVGHRDAVDRARTLHGRIGGRAVTDVPTQRCQVSLLRLVVEDRALEFPLVRRADGEAAQAVGVRLCVQRRERRRGDARDPGQLGEAGAVLQGCEGAGEPAPFVARDTVRALEQRLGRDQLDFMPLESRLQPADHLFGLFGQRRDLSPSLGVAEHPKQDAGDQQAARDDADQCDPGCRRNARARTIEVRVVGRHDGVCSLVLGAPIASI